MPPLSNEQIMSTYQLALKDMSGRHFDDALKRLEQIVASNPNIAEVHFQVARIAVETFRPQLALKPFRSAARIKPTETAIWDGWAEALALGGTAEDAASFLSAIQNAPLPLAFRSEREDRFRSRRSKSPRSPSGKDASEIARLIGLMREGAYAEAEASASMLLLGNPDLAVASNVLGGALAMQGKLAQAMPHFERAIRNDPSYAEAYDNLGRVLLEQNKPAEAIPYLRRAIGLAPYMVSAIMTYANCLGKIGQAHAAIIPLERLVQVNPTMPTCWLALGNAHTRARNYAKAEEALLEAVRTSGGTMAETYGMLAQAQVRLGKDDTALLNYEKALELDPDSAIATGGKASALQTLGRFDEARRLFERAFDLDPTNGENYRSYVAAQKTRPGDPLIERMTKLHQASGLGDHDRMNLSFAIAKALEDVKQDEQVFTYLNEANALMRKIFPFDRAAQDRERESLLQAFDQVDWQRASVSGVTAYAPIFVTGMPRSGTTLIEQIISSHSTVTGAGEIGKATTLATKLMMHGQRARPFSSLPHTAIADLGTEYETYLRDRFPQADRITDKSIQTYMYIGLLKLAMPNARFIVVRRDPRDNLFSMYKNKFPDGTHLYAYDQRDLAAQYGTFVEMMDFWRKRVPEWFYEVDYDRLVADPEPETRRLITACGLEWEDACLHPEDNDRKVETLSLFQVRQPITKSSVKGWKRFEKDLQPMLDELRKRGLVSD